MNDKSDLYLNKISMEKLMKEQKDVGTEARINLPLAQSFFLECEVITVCNPDLTNNKIYRREHPFDSIFIGNTLGSTMPDNTVLTINGILISPIFKNTLGDKLYSLSSEEIVKEVYALPELIIEDYLISFILHSPSEEETIYSEFKLYNNSYLGKTVLEKQQEGIALFIMNFLDFLNNPDIKIIDKEHSESSIKRHADNNKPVLPKYKIVTITGEQKIYIDSLNKGEHKDYSHKFWVRGHFMNLKANRYKTNIGKKIWRKAHIKGKGELIIKDYQVKKGDDLK